MRIIYRPLKSKDQAFCGLRLSDGRADRLARRLGGIGRLIVEAEGTFAFDAQGGIPWAAGEVEGPIERIARRACIALDTEWRERDRLRPTDILNIPCWSSAPIAPSFTDVPCPGPD